MTPLNSHQYCSDEHSVVFAQLLEKTNVLTNDLPLEVSLFKADNN